MTLQDRTPIGADDLTAYVDGEYPLDTRCKYPDIARRHARDMELVRRVRAALQEGDT